MSKNDIIFLTGFMTSGKSTIGKILANVLGWNFYDLDKEIEQRAGKKITEIFEEEGEEKFRSLENKILKEITRGQKLVIALGGGAIANEKNLKICKEQGTIIYLKVEQKELLRRLRKKVDRPLFRNLVLNEASDEEMLAKIKSLLEEREKYYNQADIVFPTDDSPVGKTVDDLAKTIRRYFRESKSKH